MKVIININILISFVFANLLQEAELGSANFCNGWDCRDGTCTSSFLDRCDGVVDCPDGSDEFNCISEGDGVVEICAELLEGGLGTDISLSVEVLDLGNNTATMGSDYVGLPSVLTLFSGQSVNIPSCVEIHIIDDEALENREESFLIALSTNFPEGVTLSRSRSVVEIIDNEEGITVGFSELLYVVREGDGSVQVCAELAMGGIPATLDMVSVSVSANLGNSSATANQDYTGLPSVFSFVSGQSFSCIGITIIDDSIVENEETLSLTLLPEDSSLGVRVSRGQSTVEIADNDGGEGAVSPGVSAALAIIVIIAIALALALVIVIVVMSVRRRKRKGKNSAGEMVFTQEETALVESPAAEKSEIPLTMIDS